MPQELWSSVESYINGRLLRPDALLDAVLESIREAGFVQHSIAPGDGKLLHLLARLSGARRILEIGTLGGYSSIWLARALPAGGRLISLELSPQHAALAQANIERAGLAGKVTIRVGPALQSLPQLEAEGLAPFDMVFIDADKPSNPDYLAWALRLSRPGSLIVVDNVVRDGAIADAASTDPSILGVRRMFDLIAAEPRLDATAWQSVCGKGHDGICVMLVTGKAACGLAV